MPHSLYINTLSDRISITTSKEIDREAGRDALIAAIGMLFAPAVSD